MNHPAHARARARRFAMQALYQWDLSGTGLHDIRSQFLEAEDFERADKDYFIELFNHVTKNVESIDKNISEYLDRPIGQLDPVERAILRIATWELMHLLDVPYRVAINEAVQLCKKFGAEQGHTFVNGVLDKLAQQLRASEYKKTGTRVSSQ
ncbi:MAG: transcription antitermination factor NusB [Gammaproteobacteria bacterium]|nr:transcription antitermination factor NusB [Gammaproteobacteria bacterium]